MFKDVLLALPTFRIRTDRGDSTLQKLLAKVQDSLLTEMSASSETLPNTLPLLDVAHLWVGSSARPLTLFRYYFNSIVNDINCFEIQTQVKIICNITKMLRTYLDNPTSHDAYAALKQATDRSLPLLKVCLFFVRALAFADQYLRPQILVDSKPQEEGTWKACGTLLEAFLSVSVGRCCDYAPDIISETVYRGQRTETTLGRSGKCLKMPRTGLGSWTGWLTLNARKRWMAIISRLCKTL
jgi:hypothetical protein